MKTISMPSDEDELADQATELAAQMLDEGAQPADISHALATVATRLGLARAPNAGVALTVVLMAITNAALDWTANRKLGCREPTEPGLSKPRRTH